MMMTYRVSGLFCYPEKQSLDARYWPKFRCTEALRALVSTTTATATWEPQRWLVEVCAIWGKVELKGNGAHQKPERKDKCKDRLNLGITILLLMCSALFSL